MRQLVPSAQIVEFHHETASNHFRAEPFDQCAACLRRAAGGQQVVDQQYAVAGS